MKLQFLAVQDVHNFFKKNFNFLVTDTVEGSDGNERCIRVRFSLKEAGGGSRRGKKRKNTGHSDSNDGRPFDSRGSDSWPEHLGKFLRCWFTASVQKFNCVWFSFEVPLFGSLAAFV